MDTVGGYITYYNAWSSAAFQVGVRCEGASTAGIVSAFEPITSIILGAIFLGETMGLVQYIGGGLIIIGVILTEKYD